MAGAWVWFSGLRFLVENFIGLLRSFFWSCSGAPLLYDRVFMNSEAVL